MRKTEIDSEVLFAVNREGRIPKLQVFAAFLFVLFTTSVSRVPAEDATEAFTVFGDGVTLSADGTWEYSGARGVYEVDRNGVTNPDEIELEKLLRCIVIKVVDGDTINVRFDNPPPGILIEDTVRLLGIDTPELNDTPIAAGKAKAFVESAISENEVFLAFDSKWRGSFGRLLAYVFTSDGTFVNGALLELGLAEVYYTSPCYFHDSLVELEMLGKESGTGLWECSPEESLSIRRIVNSNRREYVELFNCTNAAIEISFWTLEDRAKHVLVIPKGITVPVNHSFYIVTGEGNDAPGDDNVKLSEQPIWNNGGDIATLYDREGEVVDTYAY